MCILPKETWTFITFAYIHSSLVYTYQKGKVLVDFHFGVFDKGRQGEDVQTGLCPQNVSVDDNPGAVEDLLVLAVLHLADVLVRMQGQQFGCFQKSTHFIFCVIYSI